MKTNPFEALIDVLKEMTPDYRQKLIDSHREFGRLRTYCEAKGYIETMPNLTGIIVLKNKKEVKQLKAVIDTLKPGRFKWDDTKITGKSSKGESAEN